MPKIELNKSNLLLPFCLLLSGFCGIVAELSLFSLATTLVGGYLFTLMITMGVMMFFMGVGGGVTRFIKDAKINYFIWLEMAISILTAASVPLIYLLSAIFPFATIFMLVLFSICIGTLIGMEIPVVMRIAAREGVGLKVNTSFCFAADYLGSFIGFAIFPYWLYPIMGLFKTVLLSGAINALVALTAIYLLGGRKSRGRHYLRVMVLVFILVAAWVLEPSFTTYSRQLHFRDKVIWNHRSLYQELTITSNQEQGNPLYNRHYLKKERNGQTILNTPRIQVIDASTANAYGLEEDIRLFIDGNLQFSTEDEFRYHEILVHPAAFLIQKIIANPGAPLKNGKTRDFNAGNQSNQSTVAKVLVMGGGDGMAVRELLKYRHIEQITLVDIDPQVTEMFKHHPLLKKMNLNALNHPRVEIVNQDAFEFISREHQLYHLVILDFPDPRNHDLAKLYSLEFYQYVKLSLAPGAIVATQSCSPLYSPKSFYTIKKTMQAAGFNVLSLHQNMKSFDEWGFQIGSLKMTEKQMANRLEQFQELVPTKFLNRQAVQAAFRWGKDLSIDPKQLPENTVMNLSLVNVYNRK